jgi:hypothetical protein
MTLTHTLRSLAWLLLAAAPALAQDARQESHRVEPPEGETKQPGKAQSRFAVGEPGEPGPTSGFGPSEMTAPSPARPEQARREKGPLAEATLVSSGAGEARVRFAGGQERVLRAGDRVGDDEVQRISGRQIVLLRPASAGFPGGDARVVADFPSAGPPRVRVIWSRNPGSPIPPEVR